MNHILLIIGSPASGKSSVSKEIAKRSTKGLHIPVDDLRTMVQGGVIHPNAEWSADLVQQLALARQTATDMATRYSASGFRVVIDDFWDPHSQLHEYAPLTNKPNVIRVILKPAAHVAIARLRTRQAPSTFRTVLEDAIRLVTTDLDAHQEELSRQGWHVLDTSPDTLEESVRRILALLA